MISQSGEKQLWLSGLLQAVKDAMPSFDAAEMTEDETRLRTRLSRASKIKMAKGHRRWRDIHRARAWRDIHRARARTWLLQGNNRYEVAVMAGYEPEAFDRLVGRMRRNGWKPIGIELGIEIDKAQIRDRRELGIGP